MLYSFLFCFPGYKLYIKCMNRDTTYKNCAEGNCNSNWNTGIGAFRIKFIPFLWNWIKLSIKTILEANRRVHMISYICYQKKKINLTLCWQKCLHSSYSGIGSNAKRKRTASASCLYVPVTVHCPIALRRHLCLSFATDVQARINKWQQMSSFKGCIYAIACNVTRFNALEKCFYIGLRLENELNTTEGNCWGVPNNSCLYNYVLPSQNVSKYKRLGFCGEKATEEWSISKFLLLT